MIKSPQREKSEDPTLSLHFFVRTNAIIPCWKYNMVCELFLTVYDILAES
jgi:hypothetical protein